jgi:hypothetical protein
MHRKVAPAGEAYKNFHADKFKRKEWDVLSPQSKGQKRKGNAENTL